MNIGDRRQNGRYNLYCFAIQQPADGKSYSLELYDHATLHCKNTYNWKLPQWPTK